MNSKARQVDSITRLVNGVDRPVDSNHVPVLVIKEPRIRKEAAAIRESWTRDGHDTLTPMVFISIDAILLLTMGQMIRSKTYWLQRN